MLVCAGLLPADLMALTWKSSHSLDQPAAPDGLEDGLVEDTDPSANGLTTDFGEENERLGDSAVTVEILATLGKFGGTLMNSNRVLMSEIVSCR